MGYNINYYRNPLLNEFKGIFYLKHLWHFFLVQTTSLIEFAIYNWSSNSHITSYKKQILYYQFPQSFPNLFFVYKMWNIIMSTLITFQPLPLFPSYRKIPIFDDSQIIPSIHQSNECFIDRCCAQTFSGNARYSALHRTRQSLSSVSRNR